MKRIGDVLDIGTPAGEFLLYRYSNTLDEVLVAVLLELNEAAYLLGYNDANSFVRAFRTWEGVPPARWREEQRAKAAS